MRMERIAKHHVCLTIHFFTFLMVWVGAMAAWQQVTPPPLPLMPFPSNPQLLFQRREQAMFFHFGINTFANQETGEGKDDPSIFNPQGLDARQWVQEAKNAGFKIVILTAKHADGFCLWPSAYTNYSVKSSPWKNGTGDVVREISDAVKEAGLELGLYMAPWDRHDPSYGDTILYNEHYLGQLRELLTMYGPVSEVWLDGNKSPATADMNYLFDSWFAVIHQLQPNANIFSDAGPDVRWIGDEAGEAGTTNWSMMNRSLVTIGGGETEYLNVGDENGCDWVPPECDVSIRPGWFWHPSEKPRTVENLLEIYYKSAGRNCVLLLNIPPNTTGLLHETDVFTLREFKNALNSIFSTNLAMKSNVTASSTRGEGEGSVGLSSCFKPDQVLNEDLDLYWAPNEGLTTGYLQFDLFSNTTFNVVMIQEAVHMGQRVQRYHVDVWVQESWQTVVVGTTIGYKKLDRILKVQTPRVRVMIDEARATPLIAAVGLYLDTRSNSGCNSNFTNCLF